MRQDSFVSHRCQLFRKWFCGKVASGFEKKERCAKYWLKELQEGMDRCAGRLDIAEVMLKPALNTIRSINQLTYSNFQKDKQFDSDQPARIAQADLS